MSKKIKIFFFKIFQILLKISPSKISCDLNNHLLFERRDGGSNGYDREDNYQDLLKYKTGDKKYFYFVQFKHRCLNPRDL